MTSGLVDGEVEQLVRALPVVSIDELRRHADLLTRRDRKYLVPRASLPDLLGAVGPSVAVLSIGGRTRFAYRTAYLDTPDLLSYRDAARRRPARWKVRTRAYVDAGETWLEVKRRDRQGRTVKQRQPRTAGSDHLRAEERPFVLACGVAAEAADRLVPTLVTTYDRITLFEPSSGSRVTVDLGLRCVLLGRGAVHQPDRVIVETKTVGRPSNVDRVLWAAGLRPRRISKYATGLAALDPQLPSNRWHRTLTSAPFTLEAP